ncbi:hypothetical protein DRP05_12485 [Archaeoglobales archaeon]|nr:MAG: hypothetical protein DRP05_12485 [Archaeoglobales archaeon]
MVKAILKHHHADLNCYIDSAACEEPAPLDEDVKKVIALKFGDDFAEKFVEEHKPKCINDVVVQYDEGNEIIDHDLIIAVDECDDLPKDRTVKLTSLVEKDFDEPKTFEECVAVFDLLSEKLLYVGSDLKELLDCNFYY